MATYVFLPVFIMLVSAAGRGAVRTCNTTLTCTEVGYFRRCETFCDTQYFTCEQVGQQATLSTCPFGLVFDVDPSNPFCTRFQDCSAPNCTFNPYNCTEFSIEPVCATCRPGFYFCNIEDSVPEVRVCEDDMVFNPIPSYPGCIPSGQCPCTTANC